MGIKHPVSTQNAFTKAGQPPPLPPRPLTPSSCSQPISPWRASSEIDSRNNQPAPKLSLGFIVRVLAGGQPAGRNEFFLWAIMQIGKAHHICVCICVCLDVCESVRECVLVCVRVCVSECVPMCLRFCAWVCVCRGPFRKFDFRVERERERESLCVQYSLCVWLTLECMLGGPSALVRPKGKMF